MLWRIFSLLWWVRYTVWHRVVEELAIIGIWWVHIWVVHTTLWVVVVVVIVMDLLVHALPGLTDWWARLVIVIVLVLPLLGVLCIVWLLWLGAHLWTGWWGELCLLLVRALTLLALGTFNVTTRAFFNWWGWIWVVVDWEVDWLHLWAVTVSAAVTGFIATIAIWVLIDDSLFIINGMWVHWWLVNKVWIHVPWWWLMVMWWRHMRINNWWLLEVWW